MTLPETLKAARIEAMARFIGLRLAKAMCWDRSSIQFFKNSDEAWKKYSGDARELIAADPLEPIAGALVEALVESQIFVQLHCAEWAAKNLLPDGEHHPTHQAILDRIDAALQKAGVR